ncbi:hypothetical protein A3Q56_04726 [Intoshia linei]|uniref:Transmembrane protein 186 n=1 Tax=Intoshia linei TaxID=1819745 RepID=A0A177B1A9_9BILA|nr:hypothetical protein A3Q56_04726 [Intoshia linei]
MFLKILTNLKLPQARLGFYVSKLNFSSTNTDPQKLAHSEKVDVMILFGKFNKIQLFLSSSVIVSLLGLNLYNYFYDIQTGYNFNESIVPYATILGVGIPTFIGVLFSYRINGFSRNAIHSMNIDSNKNIILKYITFFGRKKQISTRPININIEHVEKRCQIVHINDSYFKKNFFVNMIGWKIDNQKLFEKYFH